MKIKRLAAVAALAAILTAGSISAASAEAPPEPVTLPPPIQAEEEAIVYEGFSDVPEGHWAWDYIRAACFEGWVDVPSHDAFDPDGTVTYAEFCRAACMSLYVEPGTDTVVESTLPFWYRAVSLAYEKGALAGTPMSEESAWDTGAYEPVDRGSMAVVLSNILRSEGVIDPDTGRGGSGGEFDEMGPELTSAVLDCMDAGIIDGYPDGSFGAGNPMTRSQMCKVICLLREACLPKTA